jgi:hypothetical protein
MNQAQRAQLEAKISKLESVSSAPAILTQLLQVLRKPSDEIPMEKVVELISRYRNRGAVSPYGELSLLCLDTARWKPPALLS